MTTEAKDQAARAAIAAMFCTTVDRVKVDDPLVTNTARWENWVSLTTFRAVGDAIESEVETAVPS